MNRQYALSIFDSVYRVRVHYFLARAIECVTVRLYPELPPAPGTALRRTSSEPPVGKLCIFTIGGGTQVTRVNRAWVNPFLPSRHDEKMRD